MSGLLKTYFWYSTVGTLIFLTWLVYASSRVTGEGRIRRRAVAIGIAFLALLIIPDVWALFQLEGVNWYVAWVIALLLTHIIEGGIWQRIAWGQKCPECGAWLRFYDEAVPGSPNMGRKAAECPRCGWTDSWAKDIEEEEDQ